MSRSRQGRRQRGPISQINVVPYIDVLLVLLVIFMTTASLPTGVVDIPRAGASNMRPDAYLEIQVSGTGAYRLVSRNLSTPIDRSLAGNELTAAIKRVREAERGRTQTAIPVVIAGDEKVTYDRIMQVMRSLQEQGVERVALLVKK